MDDSLYNQTKKSRKFVLILLPYIIFSLVFIGILFFNLISAPSNSKDVIIHISNYDNLDSISRNLESRNIVKHYIVVKAFVFLLNSDKHIEVGDYKFNHGQSAVAVAYQIAHSNHNLSKIKVTLTEGITNEEITNILAGKLPGFRKDLFVSDNRYQQGYLFPDTYLFFPFSTTNEIMSEIKNNFDNKIKKIDNINHIDNINDIIIMASIIEKEAKGEKDAYIISGILWRRIKLGMPLQVDIAPITYKEKGLPKLPINNPGFTSILAAINPVESNYLYYLHDKNGQAYFAVNYKEHLKNINNHLK